MQQVTLGTLGSFDVPDRVAALVAGDMTAVDEWFGDPARLDRPILLGAGPMVPPLGVAIIAGRAAVARRLVDAGAALDSADHHAFLLAARYGDADLLRLVAAAGADVDASDTGGEAFSHALYGGNRAELAVIDELGHTAREHGGQALRTAVGARDHEALRLLLGLGADIDFRGADSVYPWKPTPLCVAVRYVDLPMVRTLVEAGADLFATEKDGTRPYTLAVQRGDADIVDYLRSVEPDDLHDRADALVLLRRHKAPAELIEFLDTDPPRLSRPVGASTEIAFVDLHRLGDVAEIKHRRRAYLRLSRAVDNYSDLEILWNARTRRVAVLDVEHDELHDLATWPDFARDASAQLQRVLDGEVAGT